MNRINKLKTMKYAGLILFGIGVIATTITLIFFFESGHYSYAYIVLMSYALGSYGTLGMLVYGKSQRFLSERENQ